MPGSPKNSGVSDEADVVTDAILGGRLRLRQFRRGHRAGTDAVLLAAFVRLEADDVFVDVGAGVGTVGLALALRAPGLEGRLLEAEPGTAALAGENCRLNDVESRVSVALADLFDPAMRRGAGLADERASLVVTNPPFFRSHEGRPSPDPARAMAHALGRHPEPRDHADWLRASLALLAPKGRCCLIHRPDALPALLGAGEGRLGAIEIVPVHARAGTPAIRVLLSGVKGSRAPLRIGPALILHEADGRFTPQAEALHRGEDWHRDP